METPVFLIVERNAVIGQDLAEIVRGRDPGCQVTVVTGMDAAEAFLATQVPSLTAAFVAVPRDGEPNLAALADRIRGAGGEIVVMREFADQRDLPQGWHVLARPFTTNTVLRVLNDIQRGDPSSDGV